MIPLLLAFWFTLPSDCSARYLLDFVTTQPPANGAICQYAGDGYFNCRYWSHPSAISCDRFDAENPPEGQIWMRMTP